MKTTAAFLALMFFISSAALSADFPKGSPTFETKLSDALTKAKASSKPVIAIFSAAWCGPCQKMKKDVYPSDAVKPYHDKFIWAYLDADERGNEADMAKYNVNGIPHIEFLDSAGKSAGKQVGSASPDAFAKKLEGLLKEAKK